MNRNKIILPVIVSLLVSGLFFVHAKPASALTFEDVVDNVKNFFIPKEDLNVKNKEFNLESSISLAPEGDVNNNKDIDAGDIVRFKYVITNNTDADYDSANLKTNTERKQLNYIHNVNGATGLNDKGEFIEIPNVNVSSKGEVVISFDARINYYQEDEVLSTQPEFLDKNKKSVVKTLKKEISAKKLSAEEVKKRSLQNGLKD